MGITVPSAQYGFCCHEVHLSGIFAMRVPSKSSMVNECKVLLTSGYIKNFKNAEDEIRFSTSLLVLVFGLFCLFVFWFLAGTLQRL